MGNQVFADVDTYIAKLLANEDESLVNARNSINELKISQQCISANQGKFLQTMMRACNAKRVLELGTFVGYSAIWMAKALPENGVLFSIDIDEKLSETTKKNIEFANLSNKVNLINAKAIYTLQHWIVQKTEPFDFIFIDADKPPYETYFKLSLKLSRPGTIIVVDNVIRSGKVIDENCNDDVVNGVRKLNDFLSKCKEVTGTLIQSVGVKDHDGMAVVVVN